MGRCSVECGANASGMDGPASAGVASPAPARTAVISERRVAWLIRLSIVMVTGLCYRSKRADVNLSVG